MNKANLQMDPLYVRARQILRAQPEIGKARLAALLGIKTPTSHAAARTVAGGKLKATAPIQTTYGCNNSSKYTPSGAR